MAQLVDAGTFYGIQILLSTVCIYSYSKESELIFIVYYWLSNGIFYG